MNTELLNNRLRLAAVTTVALLSVLIAVKIIAEIKAIPSIGDTPTDMARVISVNGTSDLEATPDVATFSWTVTETGNTVEEAQNKAAEKSNKAIAYLKDNGVPASDINNQSYNTSEMYDYNSPCAVSGATDSKPISPGYNPCPKVIGYTTSQAVEVKIKGVKEGDNKVGELIAGVGKFGVKATNAYFTFDDIESVKQEARVAAVQNARAQAEEIAAALGVKIKGVVSFSESYGGTYPMAYASARDVMNQEKTIAPEIPNGEQTISASVTVTYSIR